MSAPMTTALEYLQANHNGEWLLGTSQKLFLEVVESYTKTLQQLPIGTVIFLSHREPVQFLTTWIAAASTPCRLVLCNPDWQIAEWTELYQLIKPDIFWGEAPAELLPSRQHWGDKSFQNPFPTQAILIPTGGTSGQLKFAIHTWETLSASAYGFQEYFQINPINSCCVLPLYHVSGLMQAIRSLITDGTIVAHSWKAFSTGKLPDIDPAHYCLSLVPTQLNRLLSQPHIVDFLRQFQVILLGGAPAWESLLDQARLLRLPIAPTYGMTETASQIATLKPQDFLAGQSGCGQILPHAKITIAKQASIGPLQIQAGSMMLGYFPTVQTGVQNLAQTFSPDDLGYFDRVGSLHIVGRNSEKIVTGGENVFPAELEALILTSQLVQDVAVVGIPDPDWGEAIVVAYVSTSASITTELLQQTIAPLAKYKHPKHWLACQALPRNAQGKLQRPQLQKHIISQLRKPSSI